MQARYELHSIAVEHPNTHTTLQATLASAPDSLARHRALFTHWRPPGSVEALWDLAVLVRDGACPGACERALELHWQTVGPALGRQAQQREAVRHGKVEQAVTVGCSMGGWGAAAG